MSEEAPDREPEEAAGAKEAGRAKEAAGAKEAWNAVGERFASWGRGVADRYRETGSPGGDTADETQHKLEEAARQLTAELKRGFTVLGDTFRDEQAKKDLLDAVTAVGDAITATVDEASHALRGGAASGKAQKG